MGFDKCKMACSQHYINRIIQNSFTAPKFPCASSTHSSLPVSRPLSFSCFHSFAFSSMSSSWNHRVVAFSDLFLSLCNMHLRVLHFFWWLDSSLYCWNNPLSRYTKVCLFIYLLKDILVACKFGQLWIKCPISNLFTTAHFFHMGSTSNVKTSKDLFLKLIAFDNV